MMNHNDDCRCMHGQNGLKNNGINSSAITFTNLPVINFNTPEMQGSMQAILSQNVGEYVVIEFLIGTERLMRKQGLLYYVGTSYVTLFDEVTNNFIVCDIFSIKFVYFYYPGQRPQRNYNILPMN